MSARFIAAVTVFVAATSAANSQPFPGYGGNPLVRYDNGAVGELLAYHGGQSGTVRYYDGVGTVDHVVDLQADPDYSPADADEKSVSEMLTGNDDFILSNPNACLVGTARTPATKKEDIRVCTLTLMDQCVNTYVGPDQNGANVVWHPEPVPCWQTINVSGRTISVKHIDATNGPHCPERNPSCTSGSGNQVFTTIPFPAEISHLTTTTDAEFNAEFSAVSSRCHSGDGPAYPAGCEVFQARNLGTYPTEEDFERQIAFAPTTAPVNSPVPTPSSGGQPLPGETMNPTGFDTSGAGGDSGGFSDGAGSDGGTGGDGSDPASGGGTVTVEFPEAISIDNLIGMSPEEIGNAPDIEQQEFRLDELMGGGNLMGFEAGWLPDDECPPPYQFDLFGTTIPISVEPACNLAIRISGFIMALSLLSGLRLAWGALS